MHWRNGTLLEYGGADGKPRFQCPVVDCEGRLYVWNTRIYWYRLRGNMMKVGVVLAM